MKCVEALNCFLGSMVFGIIIANADGTYHQTRRGWCRQAQMTDGTVSSTPQKPGTWYPTDQFCASIPVIYPRLTRERNPNCRPFKRSQIVHVPGTVGTRYIPVPGTNLNNRWNDCLVHFSHWWWKDDLYSPQQGGTGKPFFLIFLVGFCTVPYWLFTRVKWFTTVMN